MSFVASVVAQPGCVSPHTYGTPRVLPAGKVAHTLGAETFSGFAVGAPPSLVRGGKRSAEYFLPPSYTVNIGVGDRTEIGLRVAQLSIWGFHLKFHLLKGRHVDVGVNPMAQLSLDEGVRGHLHVPLMFGFNIHKTVTFVATPGMSYVDYLRAGGRGDELLGDPPTIDTHGVLARMGAGFNLRPRRFFAFQPEVTLFRSLQSSHDAPFTSITWLAVGLGFIWGPQPSYDDDEDACPPGSSTNASSNR